MAHLKARVMRELSYLDFDLLVEPAEQGGYRARVVEAPAGETGPIGFTAPFSELEIENFLLRIGRPRRGPERGEQSVEAAAVREFGGRLFDAVFHDELRLALATSLVQAEGRDVGLRLRLRLSDCPELVDLPWEYLYDRDNRRFLALSEWTPVVRYLQFPGRIRPLTVRPPLQILVLISSPTDFPPLDVIREWEKLRMAVADLARTGRVLLERVPTGTLADLRRQLRRTDYHVFHYIGHGGYEPQTDDGVLVLEGPTGRGQPVSGQDLGMLLHDQRTLRLVVLNSCEGARSSRTDPYSGSAQSLVRQGIPAVVAMQFEITDAAAITFAHSLYEAVADGYPLDAAVADARKAVRHDHNPVEWGTPVLYLRAPDGRIFAPGRVEPSPDDLLDDPDYAKALEAFHAERWDTVVQLLERADRRHPSHPQVTERLAHARRQQMARWDAAAHEAVQQARWSDAVEALERLVAADAGDTGFARRLESARAAQMLAKLQSDIRELYDAGQWAAVVSAGQRLAELDGQAADPNGLVTAAKAKLAAPETAGNLAGMGQRFAARIVDWLIFLIPLLVLSPDGDGAAPSSNTETLTTADTLSLLGTFLTIAVYEVVLVAVWGYTVGKWLLGLKVVRRDGGPVGWRTSLLRWTVQFLAWVPGLFFGAVILYLSPFWDKTGRRQGWHDKAAGTVVVKRT